MGIQGMVSSGARVRLGLVLVALTAVMTLTVGGAHAAPGGVRYLDEVFDDVSVTTGLQYGAAVNARGEDQDLLFDLYQPVGDAARDRGLYIWAFGSGFRFGSRSASNPLTDYARRGWVGMAIDYRLHPDEVPPNTFVGVVTDPTTINATREAARDAQHDMQAAVRYARAHADELGIDPDRIAVGGISAGGITALATAFNESDPGDSGTPGVSSRVAAAVSHAGAYAPVLQGAFPQPGAPPVAMYHGTTDEQVPFPTSPPGCVLTLAVGNTCEYGAFVGRTHRTLGTDLALGFLYRQVIAPPDLGARLAIGNDGDGAVNDANGTSNITESVGLSTPMGVGAAETVVVPTDVRLLVSETQRFLDYLTSALS